MQSRDIQRMSRQLLPFGRRPKLHPGNAFNDPIELFHQLRTFAVFTCVSLSPLKPDELRSVIRQTGFKVRTLAVQIGMDVRTLERRFRSQFQTTPKAWIMRERMHFAPSLLAAGLSNKEVAASLQYSCQSNFCRDFKRCYGSTPQEFARASNLGPSDVAN
jgi:AraC-like DNA-binding protein